MKLVREKATWVGGKIPVNPSGGLLALGHPLSATGVRNIAEIVMHLRGQAGERQTPNTKVGLAHMLGGFAAGMEFWLPHAGLCQLPYSWRGAEKSRAKGKLLEFKWLCREGCS